MPKFSLALIVALLVIAGVGASRIDTTRLPLVRGGLATPQDTATATGTATGTQAATGTLTRYSTLW